MFSIRYSIGVDGNDAINELGVEMILANDNTFGVELETVMPVTSLTANNWQVGAYHVGADIPDFAGWKTMRDGSIQPSDFTETGVEVVSPVLSGAEGIASVDAMVARLRTMGARVNASCGLHVHIGFNGSAQQLARLLSLVSLHEKALYASTGTKSRESNHYCGSIKVAYKPLENMTAMATMSRIRGDRYRALNLQNLIDGRRPTVEFRVFAGTLNAIKIQAYIQLCLGLVQKAMEAKKSSKWDMATTRKHDGRLAMQELLLTLGWNDFKMASPKHLTAGLLVPAQRDTMKKMMMRMAKKYDATV